LGKCELPEILAAYRCDASACTLCHNLGLLHQGLDGQPAPALFHKEATGRSGVLFVFEAPNLTDTYDPDKGRMTCDPSTDPTGRFIFELLAHVHLRPEEVVFTNAVLCLPAERNGKYPVRAQQRKACSPWLARLINDLDPRVVVTCGAAALSAIKNIAPHGLRLRDNAGKVCPWNGRLLLPLYHPSVLGQLSRPREQQLADIEALRPVHCNSGVGTGGLP